MIALFAFVLGGVSVYLAWQPVSYVWGVVLGDEICSQASFPRLHIARIYSAAGIGDQSLIFSVDGWTVYRTGDWEPGNVHEQIIWDESGETVTFIASNRKVFKYNTISQTGKREY